MKFIRAAISLTALVACGALPGALHGQQTLDQDKRESLAAEDAIAAFSLRPPDEASPFFSDRELARIERTRQARGDLRGATGPNETAMYPATGGERSAGRILSSFFTSMFSSVRIGRLGRQTPDAEITLDPMDFSLADRREVETIFLVRNNGRKILRFDYPTTQRFDLSVRNGTGEVVERWSDDRAFSPEEGIVFINPGERIEYREKIPTRDMQPGVFNEVTAEVANHPDYSAVKRFTPAP